MEEVIKYLKQTIKQSNVYWDKGKGYAFIVNFLEQSIENAISDLETIKTK